MQRTTQNIRKQSRNSRRNSFRQCGLESLESRQLMAADFQLDTKSGILYITGGSTKDYAQVRLDTRGTSSTADDRFVVNVNWQAELSSGGKVGAYSRAAVKSIVFNGNGGDDEFFNHTSLFSEADGGAGNDILVGGHSDDHLYGGDGRDYIDGRRGNDKLYGGASNDTIFGDHGNDFLYGNTGHDALYGGAGRDSIFGESGNDWLDGGADTELKMNGGTGIDTFVDDTRSFPGGDFGSSDTSTTKHDKLAMFDYNVAGHSDRSTQRLKYYRSLQAPAPVPTPEASLNDKVLTFAQSKLGQKVGDGGCTRLVEEALAAAGAQAGSNFGSPGYYVWGRKLTAGEAIQPGDIVQFGPGARFETANSYMVMDSYFGHAGIIESVNGSTITILNQNMAGSPVIRTTINLATQTVGTTAIYRPIPR